MESDENGGRAGRAGAEFGAKTDGPHDRLPGVQPVVGGGLDAATLPWPGRDRPRRGTADPEGGIDVVDHVELGRLVADWAADPASRPSDVGELKSQLRGVATIPGGILTVRFVEDAADELVIRLPAVDALEADLVNLSDPMRRGGCPVPAFYSDQLRPGISPMLTPVDMFLSRLGDMALGKP